MVWKVGVERMGKKLLNALFKTILSFAVLHLLILVIAAIKNKDLSLLNIFNILQIHLLLPSLASDIIAGVVLVIAVYGLFLIWPKGSRSE